MLYLIKFAFSAILAPIMTTTTHTAIGSVIGLYILNPILGFVVGLLLHFLVDMIPHGDGDMRSEEERKLDKKNTKVFLYGTLDVLVAFFLLIVLVNVRDPQFILPFTMAIAGSVLPDLLVGIHDATKSKLLDKFVALHWFFHDFFLKRFGDVKLSFSLLGQAVFIIIWLNVF